MWSLPGLAPQLLQLSQPAQASGPPARAPGPHISSPSGSDLRPQIIQFQTQPYGLYGHRLLRLPSCLTDTLNSVLLVSEANGHLQQMEFYQESTQGSPALALQRQSLCSAVPSPTAGTGTCHTRPAGSRHSKPAGCPWCRGSFPTCWHLGPQHTPNREQSYPGKVLQVEVGKKAGRPRWYQVWGLAGLTTLLSAPHCHFHLFLPHLPHACSSSIHYSLFLFPTFAFFPLNIP